MKVERINLLGLRVKVRFSSNINLEGVEGRVVDETKNLLIVVKDDGRRVKIPKDSCIFEVELGSKRIMVDGLNLVGTLVRRLCRK